MPFKCHLNWFNMLKKYKKVKIILKMFILFLIITFENIFCLVTSSLWEVKYVDFQFFSLCIGGGRHHLQLPSVFVLRANILSTLKRQF